MDLEESDYPNFDTDPEYEHYDPDCETALYEEI